MCHLILALPIVALPVLWLLPPGVAVPVYAVIVGISIDDFAKLDLRRRQPLNESPARQIRDGEKK